MASKESIQAWAENQIKMALDSKPAKETSFDPKYDDSWKEACTKAFDIFKSLTDSIDEKNPYSFLTINIAADVVKRLVHNKSIVPIKSIDEGWTKNDEMSNEDYAFYTNDYQTSLYKVVNLKTDEIMVTDSTRIMVSYDKEVTDIVNSLGFQIVDQMFPIEIPYFAHDEAFRVFMHCVDDGKVSVDYIITPYYEYIKIGKTYEHVGDGLWKEVESPENSKVSHDYANPHLDFAALGTDNTVASTTNEAGTTSIKITGGTLSTE